MGSKPLMTPMEVLSGLSTSSHLKHVRGSGCYNFVSQCLPMLRIADHVTMLRSISTFFWTIQTRKRQFSVMFLGYVLLSFAPNGVSLPERLRLCKTMFNTTVCLCITSIVSKVRRLGNLFLYGVFAAVAVPTLICNVHMPQNSEPWKWFGTSSARGYCKNSAPVSFCNSS